MLQPFLIFCSVSPANLSIPVAQPALPGHWHQHSCLKLRKFPLPSHLSSRKEASCHFEGKWNVPWGLQGGILTALPWKTFYRPVWSNVVATWLNLKHKKSHKI
jgi:hypothetical protein